MKNVDTHLAWDEGSIVDTFCDIFGNDVRDIIECKTTKTYCGKRRPMKFIDNENPTCPKCIQDKKDWDKKTKELEIEIQKRINN